MPSFFDMVPQTPASVSATAVGVASTVGTRLLLDENSHFWNNIFSCGAGWLLATAAGASGGTVLIAGPIAIGVREAIAAATPNTVKNAASVVVGATASYVTYGMFSPAQTTTASTTSNGQVVQASMPQQVVHP